MPGLSRHAPPLLRTINGKKHASNADHEEAQSDSSGLSEPPGDDEYDDLTRDPDPSSDEETEPAPLYIPPKNIRPPKRAQGKADSINIHAAKAKTNGRGKEQETKALGKSSGLKKPSTEEPKRFESPRSKHGRTFRQPKTSNETQETVVEAPRSQLDYVLESSQNSKRARVAYGSKSASSSQKARGKEGSNSQKGGLKRPREASADLRSPKRRFRNTADSSSQIESPSQATSVGFKRPAGSAELPEPEEMSSPPSTPSSPPPEVIDLASPQPPPGTSPCPLCGDHVEISFKEDFEIENCRGRHMSLKMQERFCQAHKSRNAQRTWKDRSYPEVDWSALAGRLEIHREHILAILNRKKESYFRDELERAIREGKARTVVQRYFAPDGSGARVGYYGTRGQKMMWVVASLLICV